MSKSLDDVINAAYRIKNSAKDVQTRSVLCADSLQKRSAELSRIGGRNRSTQEAAKLTNEAQREVREAALSLVRLQNRIDAFISQALQ